MFSAKYCELKKLKKSNKSNFYDQAFKERMDGSLAGLKDKFEMIYGLHRNGEKAFASLLKVLSNAYANRRTDLKESDFERTCQMEIPWFLSNKIVGMSLYVDRFSGDLRSMKSRLGYLENLGVNLFHLMPLFESPDNESDGGYAVSDFRKVHQKYGTLDDLKDLSNNMRDRGFYLMLDIVINHTSHHHEWAKKAKKGSPKYQDYYYFFDDENEFRTFEQSMPEVFPEAAPGNFTYIPELDKWAMTVFHNYQWDLNYTNPEVFVDIIDTILFYANLGVDILRIDAPAFIWKRQGTNCQNLPEVHTLLQLMKMCVQIATPGMALLGEAIVAPDEIIKYFGTGNMAAKECDVAYNATHMALQWDALATQEVNVMLQGQEILSKKPRGTTWISYTRCHDDIGLAYHDYMISNSGFDPYLHRKFLKDYYTGSFVGSDARGALFSVNERTGDARISGSLASLCGLETALKSEDQNKIKKAIDKIGLMQAMSFFIGGIPMLFYGDEVGYINDYSFLKDDGKNYDNRWMHRPIIDWNKNELADKNGNTEHAVYSITQKLISIRKYIPVVADKSNITWMRSTNKHVAAFLRAWDDERVYCLFNFSKWEQRIPNHIFKEHGQSPVELYDHWSYSTYSVKNDNEGFNLSAYSFYILEPVN